MKFTKLKPTINIAIVPLYKQQQQFVSCIKALVESFNSIAHLSVIPEPVQYDLLVMGDIGNFEMIRYYRFINDTDTFQYDTLISISLFKFNTDL